MKAFLAKWGKWAAIIYMTQALIGIGIGVGAAVMYPEIIEEVLRCVTH